MSEQNFPGEDDTLKYYNDIEAEKIRKNPDKEITIIRPLFAFIGFVFIVWMVFT